MTDPVDIPFSAVDLSDLDYLMSLNPLGLTKWTEEEKDAYIASIVAYQRKMRALRESGVKTRKGTASKESQEKGQALLDRLGVVKKPKVDVGGRRF